MGLSDKILLARKNKGLTQEQLADLSNVTVRTIQRIESGESMPRPYTLQTIAAALDIPFETLRSTGMDHNDKLNAAILATSKEETGKHFLQMLCLSCFSYLVIPFVHFLVPAYLLRKAGEQHPAVIAFARKVIRAQVTWLIVLHSLMFATLAFNLISIAWFRNTQLVSYLWPFFMMYLINAVIITAALLRIKKVNMSTVPQG